MDCWVFQLKKSPYWKWVVNYENYLWIAHLHILNCVHFLWKITLEFTVFWLVTLAFVLLILLPTRLAYEWAFSVSMDMSDSEVNLLYLMNENYSKSYWQFSKLVTLYFFGLIVASMSCPLNSHLAIFTLANEADLIFLYWSAAS